MKTILLTLLLIFSFKIFSQETKTERLLASCCETEGGKCTGSATCTTCKNCVRCKHCSNGGSCGVCAGTKTSGLKSNKKNTSLANDASQSISLKGTSKEGSKLFYVKSVFLYLRKEPKYNAIVISKLLKEEPLIFIDSKDEWIKVKVKKTQKTGWVLASNLKEK